MKKNSIISSSLLISATLLSACDKNPEKPNIILILADDMGYSDIGVMGSEINTPNIDMLAEQGILYNNFYNGARSCPTRASLLTGLYAHQAGMGGMEPDRNLPGFRGNISRNCVTIAEALKLNGYSTYMTGKWHLTNKVKPDNEEDKYNWPIQRGFDRFYGTIAGAGNFWHPRSLTRNNDVIENEHQNDTTFYYTEKISQNATEYLKDHFSKRKNSPLFLYVAYTAPHWPLHALDEDIEKYRGIYNVGWDKIRNNRFVNMINKGLVDPGWGIAPRDERVQAWDDIDITKVPEEVQKSIKDANQLRSLMSEKMATYAAMIECMDRGVGDIVKSLKKSGEFDNTLIVFLSDNGGCDEWGNYGFGWANYRTTGDISGTAQSDASYGPAWAHVSNTPFSYYKLYTHEGGISTPLIIHWPDRIKNPGVINREVGHIIDIMPTFIDAAGGSYPSVYNENEIKSLEGVSLLPTIEGTKIEERPLFWEHIGRRAVRLGDWKLVSKDRKGESWALYNIVKDRNELNDLSDSYPDRVKHLNSLWQDWANRSNVYPNPWIIADN